MASNDNFDLGDDDLDNLDFGDLDFDDPFAPSNKSRSPVEAFKDSTIRTVKDRMLDQGLLRRLVSMALPKGYSQLFNAYDALDSAAGTILKDNASDLQPYMRTMNRKLAMMSPAVKRMMPKNVRDALDDSEYDNSTSSDTGPDELSINLAGIDKLFASQADEKIRNEFRDAVKDTRENKRFASEMEAMSLMGRGIGRLVGFQDSFTASYMRKSLELKYRHLDVSIRTLKAQQEFFSISKTYLDGIQKNTGLPDFVKMRTTEVIKQQLSQRLAASAMRSAGNFTANYFRDIQRNASQLVGSALEANRELAGGEDFGMTRAQLAGRMLGGLAGDSISGGLQLVGGTIADRAAPYVERIPGMQAGGNFLRRNLTGIPQRLNEYAKSETTGDGWFGLKPLFEEAIKGLLDRHSPTSIIAGSKLDALDKPAIFDNMFHRAVTDVIPSFLGSMDRSLRMLVSGNDEEEMAYSYYSNQLVGRTELGKSHIRLALKDNNGQGIRTEVDALLREMGANVLSVDARRVLRRQLFKDMTAANDFKPERYIKVETWNTVPQPIAEEIIEFFADTFGLDPSGNLIDNRQETKDLTQNVRQKFIELTERLPDFGGRMDVLQNVVGRRAWRDLGLSRYNGDYSDIINMDALNDLIVNEGAEQDLSPPPPGSPPPPDSGSIGDRIRRKADAERKKLADQRKAAEEAARKAAQDAANPNAGGPGPIVPRPFPGGPRLNPGDLRVDANVKFPDLMNSSDSETHKRLDAMMDLTQQSNQWLEYILEASLMANAGGAGSSDIGTPPPGSPPGTPPAPRPGRRGMLSRILGIGGGAVRGLGAYFKFTYGMIGKGLGLGARGIGGAARLGFGRIDGLGVSDIFVRGTQDPALTAKGIRRGQYIDVKTQKVISKISDITGPVVNEQNETVITQQEFDDGLYNGEGQSLAGYLGGKALGLAGMTARGIGAYVGFTYGTMFKAGKWAMSKLVDQFTQFDAYLPGDAEPRIRSVLMKKGLYRNITGEPIMSLKDITGPVYEVVPGSEEMREIVSQSEIDQYKSFYTKNGSLLFTVGRGGINLGIGAAQLAVRGAKAYGRFALGVYKGMWRGAKAIGRGIGGLGKRMFGGNKAGIGMLDNEMAFAAVEIQSEQLSVLQSMYNFMRNTWGRPSVTGDVDGDGVREYSWQDILRRRKAVAAGGVAATGDNADVVAAIKQLGDRLDDNFDDLAEVTEEAGESSLLENAADLSDIGGGGEGRGRRRRRGAPGRIRRGLNALGRGLSRIPGAGLLGRGALAVGGALLSGASAIGGALFSGATAVVGALGAPVLLGAAAVAGIGYLGYKYYQSEKAKDFPLLYLRMTQYGVAPTDKDRVEQMIQLEATVKNGVRIGKDGVASISREGVDAQAIMNIFGVKDAEQQTNLFKWMQQRFRPVFLAHCAAMMRIRNTTDLVSADQGIGDGDIDTYLTMVDMGGLQDVYNDTDTSPFDSDLDTDADDVTDAIKMVRSRRKSRIDHAAQAAAVGITVGRQDITEKNTTVSVSSAGTDKASDIINGLKLTSLGAAGALGATYQSTTPTAGDKTSLNIPTAVRYKAYGLKDLNLARCKQLQQAEEVYWTSIQYNGTDKALVAGDASLFEQKILDIFKPADDDVRADVIRWLNYRFLPVLLQYAISVRRRYNGDARDAHRNLTGTLMHQVLDEVSRAQGDSMFGKVSIWTIKNTPWPGIELETMPGSIQIYLDSLDRGDKNKVVNVDGLSAQKRVEGAGASYAETLTNTALGNQRTSLRSPGVGQTGTTLSNYGKVYGSGVIPGGAPGQTAKGVGDGSLLMAGSQGSQVQHPGGGTGGDINTLPSTTGKGWEAMGPIIQGAAKMVGFDPVIAGNVAAIESRLDPNASSGIAHGLFQFTKGTWSDMMKQYGAQYGIAPGTSPMDPRANAILGACYLRDNYNGLSKTLGGKVTDNDLYMAHFLGLGGAKRFLTAPRSASAADHASAAAIENNGSVFYHNWRKPGQRIRSVGEVLAEVDRRMNGARKMTGSPLSSTPASVPETSVPQGPTATDAAPANGGVTASESGLAAPSDSAIDASAAGLPTGATPADAAAAANGGASGTPTNGTRPVSLPSNPSATPSTGSEIPPSTPMLSMAPTPSPSRTMSEAAQQTNATQQAIVSEAIAPILQEQLLVQKSMDATLKEILKRQGGGAMQTPAPTMAAQEPMARNPVNPTRAKAVT